MTGNFAYPRNAFLGFDHIFDQLENIHQHAKDTYPPHNVIKYDDFKYDIELAVAGFNNIDSKKIILTGGSSQLPGLFEVASRILNASVRIGKPIRVQGLPHAANGPDFSAAVGLALHAGHPQDECWDFNLPFAKTGLRKFNGVLKWFVDNW